MQRVCVFCGSSDGARPEYRAAAERLGGALARRGVGLVYGGAGIGLMGALADAVLAGGGEAVGVIPGALVEREVAHDGLTRQHVVGSMHERKARMAELADAFVALPGGLGTLEELFETWTWGLLGLHRKPFGLVDAAGYYAPLVGFLDHGVREGFVRKAHREMLVVDTDADRLLDRLHGVRTPAVPRMIEEAQT